MIEEKIERNKVLVIEDHAYSVYCYKQELGDRVDLPIKQNEGNYGCVNKEYSLENIQSYLKETPYAVIFMDGQLKLELSRFSCDGEVLVDKIRKGEYGSLNQNVEIQNISSAFEIPGTRYDAKKMSLEWEDWSKRLTASTCDRAIAYAKKKLGIE